jgi:integrase
VTLTTPPTLLPGVSKHGKGWRVRLAFPGMPRYAETGLSSPDAANARSIELRNLRTLGLTPAAAPLELVLRDAAQLLFERKCSTVSRKTKRKLEGRGLEHWQRSLKPWREGELAALPLSMLRRDRVEDVVLARAAEAPTSARNELEALKAVLRNAGARGARFELSLLSIDPVIVERRRRRALTVPELELLAFCAPAYARRLLLFKGTVGARSGELFTLTDDCVDLEGATFFVPAELCKERIDKWVDLTAEEVELLKLQLLERPGSRLVFPKKQGGQWNRSHFRKLVWVKACRRAAAHWRDLEGARKDAVTPFCDLTPHDLRSTAATLMRDAGFAREDAAARLGHADAGELLSRVYDQGDRRARVRRAVAEKAPGGLRQALTGLPR